MTGSKTVPSNFFKTDHQAHGAKGLVFIGENILVYRRDDKTDVYPLHLDLPGGGKDRDETPFQTFQREVHEEFNLLIGEDSVVYAKRYESTVNPGTFAWFPVVKLPASQENNIVFGNEGQDYRLMLIDEFLQRKDAWPILQVRASEYLEQETN
jgi:8-oxo-dGTP diphosphatase